ncbi:hypothetical protein EDB19DRAFT_320075 [Suillus lakei]|nr:hypothetical protein EDB19DRAFT_320075 [Suillus lakei]
MLNTGVHHRLHVYEWRPLIWNLANTLKAIISRPAGRVSIKSSMRQWLLDVYVEFAGGKTAFEDHLNPSALPGWAYARALTLFAREKAECMQQHGRTEAELRKHRAFQIQTDGIGLSPA